MAALPRLAVCRCLVVLCHLDHQVLAATWQCLLAAARLVWAVS